MKKVVRLLKKCSTCGGSGECSCKGNGCEKCGVRDAFKGGYNSKKGAVIGQCTNCKGSGYKK